MRVELIPIISEFIQTQINFEIVIRKLISRLETDFNPAMIWAGFKGESKESFINRLKIIAHGIEDLDTIPWALEWDAEGELASVVKKTTDGVEFEVTPEEANQFIKNLCHSISSGSLQKHLEAMCSLALSQLYYQKFLTIYVKDNSNIKDEILAPFQRLTKFTLMLERLKKYSEKSDKILLSKAIEIISKKIATTNELMTPELANSKKIDKQDQYRMRVKAKIIELKNNIRILWHRKPGIFRDRLKTPLQELIVSTAKLVIEELKIPNISVQYADKLHSSLKVLQSLTRFKGKGGDLREIALPFIAEILKSLRPAQPDAPPAALSSDNNSTISNTTPLNSSRLSMEEVRSYQSTLDFFANASNPQSSNTYPSQSLRNH